MIKIAVYGKGGIGKSTTVSNLSAALADSGLRVMQIGCDPKADSTLSLHNGEITPILNLVREKRDAFSAEEMFKKGYGGVSCVEAGGPSPGLGCAGRGIITALEKLADKNVYDICKPDVIFYDVLGDVVCGGFTMPMRDGYADFVLIVTSGEKMSLYAAENIALAVEHFRDRGYAGLGGFILNKRGIPDEYEKAAELAEKCGAPILGVLSRSDTVSQAELLGKTVIEAFPESEMADEYRTLAYTINNACKKAEEKSC